MLEVLLTLTFRLTLITQETFQQVHTIPLNARNIRRKALLTVAQAVDGATTGVGHDDSFTPYLSYLANPRSCNYLHYNNILVPDRQVNLTRFFDENYVAVALREMMLALHAAGINVNTYCQRLSHKHWFLGRRLALIKRRILLSCEREDYS